MKILKATSFFDGLGIALSFLCLIHCLLLPFVISLLPLFMGEIFGGENVHLMMSIIILPVSILAVFPAYQKHKKKKVLFFIGTGLFLIVGAVFFGHDLLGEVGEKVMTLLGGAFLILGHCMNRSFCHSCPKCESTNTSESFLKAHL